MAFSEQLHPRAPVGTSNGGQFTAGSSSSSSKSTTAKGSKPAAKTATVAPNGLGYTSAQWAQLQQLEAMAKAGKKLDAHQEHELHVAHQKKLAAMAKPKTAAKPKAKKAVAKKATVKKAAPKKTTAKAAPKPTTAAQKKANAAAFHL